MSARDGFQGGLIRSPEETLEFALGLKEDKRLRPGPKSLLGMVVAEHCQQVMHDQWLAWEVRRAVKRKYPNLITEEFSGSNPFPNFEIRPERAAILDVIVRAAQLTR